MSSIDNFLFSFESSRNLASLLLKIPTSDFETVFQLQQHKTSFANEVSSATEANFDCNEIFLEVELEIIFTGY